MPFMKQGEATFQQFWQREIIIFDDTIHDNQEMFQVLFIHYLQEVMTDAVMIWSFPVWEGINSLL